MSENKKNKRNSIQHISENLNRSGYNICLICYQWKEIASLFKRKKFMKYNLLKWADSFLENLENYFFISFCINFRHFIGTLRNLNKDKEIQKFILEKTFF